MKNGVVFVGLMLVSAAMFAQNGRKFDKTAMAAKRIEKMKTALSLTDDQVARLKAIDEKFSKSFEQLRKDTAISVGTSRARAKKLVDSRQAEVKSVLTPAQQTKWNEYKEKHRAQRWQHKGDSEHGHKK